MSDLVSPRSVETKGATSATKHSYSLEETEAFADYINSVLDKDPDVSSMLPIDPETMDLFTKQQNGVLLCKLINDAVPDTIDERVIVKSPNTFQKHENQTLVVESARAIGCVTVNVGPGDLLEGRPHLVLGLVWQIIRIGLFARINLTNHPGLYRLLEDGETIEDLLRLPVDQLLLRWMNYHLKNAGSNRRVKNFSGDIKDSEAYTLVLEQVAPASKGIDRTPLNTSDLSQRAELMLQNADKLECRKFVRPRDVTSGNAKLNLAFVANLFNHWPGLEPMEEVVEEVIEETREERQYRNWINSLGLHSFVKHLYADLADGLALLKIEDYLEPGCVNWKAVARTPKHKLHRVGNCNMVVDVGKSPLGLSVVGIGGPNIVDMDKTRVLAIVWQLMRADLIKMLTELGGGQRVTDDDILAWANEALSGAGHSVRSFKDSSLASGVVVLDLINAVKSGSVNPDLIERGNSEEAHLQNAKLAVSTARKIGAKCFALPEDIVEVKPKMMMSLFAGLMAVAKSQ